MIEILTVALWAGFASYFMGYFVKAKDYAPLSSEEVRMLWKIHKRDSRCQSFRWRKIVFNGKIVGFECGCGHRHVQRRPVAFGVYKGRGEVIRNRFLSSKGFVKL